MEISTGKRVLYSLWIVPMVPVVLIATMLCLYSLPGTYVRDSDCFLMTFFGLLVPVSYLLGWLTSLQREERLAFLKVLTGYLACITLNLLAAVLHARSLGYSLLVLVLYFAMVGAFVWALRRRKAVVVRAALHRSAEQRELRAQDREVRRERAEARRQDRAAARRQAEEELVAAERAKMTHGAGASSRRRADVEPQHAGGSALISTIGAFAPAAPQPAAEPQAEAAVQVLDGLVGSVQAAQAAPVAEPSAQPAHTSQAAAVAPATATAVDVNSCTAGELLALPGMSAAVARSIVTERDQHGSYRSFEEVVTRCALKPHQVASFATLLTVSPSKTRPAAGTHRARTLDL